MKCSFFGLWSQCLLTVSFCPFDIIYRASRYFFIGCVVRCVLSPLYQVTCDPSNICSVLFHRVYVWVCCLLLGYSPGLLSRRSINIPGNELYGLGSGYQVCVFPQKIIRVWFGRCKHSEAYCFTFVIMDGLEISRNGHMNAMRVTFIKNSTLLLQSFLTGSALLRY